MPRKHRLDVHWLIMIVASLALLPFFFGIAVDGFVARYWAKAVIGLLGGSSIAYLAISNIRLLIATG